ncbi:hypothetical protein [Trueperella pyogenes]|uniref:hypothetical protein n=1 Tax=Trueperella pyogenes TaxID=1661 RepID=UPI00324E7891
MFDHHATTDFASRITHPHIQTTSNQSFRHHTNEKYAQKQHKMANLEVESDRLKKHQTPPHQQKTRNQQHKMAYKPPLTPRKRASRKVALPPLGHSLRARLLYQLHHTRTLGAFHFS